MISFNDTGESVNSLSPSCCSTSKINIQPSDNLPSRSNSNSLILTDWVMPLFAKFCRYASSEYP